jgi:hypothetical protein
MERQDMNLRILTLIKSQKSLVRDQYVREIAEAAKAKAEYDAYKKYVEPEEGPCGFMASDSRYKTQEGIRDTVKARLEQWEEIYEYAVGVFIVNEYKEKE